MSIRLMAGLGPERELRFNSCSRAYAWPSSRGTPQEAAALRSAIRQSYAVAGAGGAVAAGGVVLLPPDVGLHIGWRHQSYAPAPAACGTNGAMRRTPAPREP
jgi:hypothetical protein